MCILIVEDEWLIQPFGPREVLLRKPFALSDLLAAVRQLLAPPISGQAVPCRTAATSGLEANSGEIEGASSR